MLRAWQGKDGSGLCAFSCEPGGTGMSWDELLPYPSSGGFKDIEPGVPVVVAGAGR